MPHYRKLFYLYLLSLTLVAVVLLTLKYQRFYSNPRVQDELLFHEGSTMNSADSTGSATKSADASTKPPYLDSMGSTAKSDTSTMPPYLDSMGSASKSADASTKPAYLDSIVVPIAAYFDARPQNSHKTSTIILVDVLEKLVNNVLGCAVDGVEQTYSKKKPIYLDWWIQSKYPVSHTELILSCYDMNTNKNSSVSILFGLEGRQVKLPVKTRGVVMPGQSAEYDEVIVCTSGYGTPQDLDQWLLYQQTIGVKLIHLNVDVSFLQNVNKSEVLRNFLDTGYVQMVVWMPYLNESQVFLYSQSFKYQDCIYRYQNKYKYMMVVDFDEYFIPLIQHKNVLWYARKLLVQNRGSVGLPSIQYYCKISGAENMTLPKDGNITKQYDFKYSIKRTVPKCIHLVKAVDEVSVHRAATLLSPYNITNFRSTKQSKCYIAHIVRYENFLRKCKQ